MLGDVGDLGEHLGDGAGGQRFEDHGDGGQARVVGDEEVPVGGGRRVIRRARPPQRHREPWHRPVDPGRRRALVAVADHQHRQLTTFGIPLAHRVVGTDRAIRFGHLLEALPRERLVDRQLVATRRRQQHVHEGVRGARGERREVVAADDDTTQMRMNVGDRRRPRRGTCGSPTISATSRSALVIPSSPEIARARTMRPNIADCNSSGLSIGSSKSMRQDCSPAPSPPATMTSTPRRSIDVIRA